MIIPFLAFLGISLGYSQLFKIKFTHSIPASLSLILTFLYLGAMGGELYFTTWFVYLMGIIFLLVCTYQERVAIRENLYQYRFEILSISGMIIAYGLYVQNAYLSVWDEFSHWGVFTKELLMRGALEKASDTTSILSTHAQYPRGPALYHYFFLVNSGYSEPGALFAHFVFHLIYLAPLMANRKAYHSFFLVIPMLAIAMVYTTGIRTIYNDSTIAIMFSSIVSIYILEPQKNKAIFTTLPIFVFLPLFREVGLMLGLVAASIIIAQEMRSAKSYIPNNLFLCLCILIAPFISNYVWHSYFQATHHFLHRTAHSLTNLYSLIHNLNSRHLILIRNFIYNLYKPIFHEGMPIILGLLYISWNFLHSKNDSSQKKLFDECKLSIKVSAIGLLFFCLWRLYLYLVIYNYHDVLNSGSSLVRYIGSYSLVFGVIACSYIKIHLEKHELKTRELIALVILLIYSSIFIELRLIKMHTKLTDLQYTFNSNANSAGLLIRDGVRLTLDFDGKKRDFDCYRLSYEMSPYLSSSEFAKCKESPENYDKNIHEPFQDLLQEYEDKCGSIPENCALDFRPFYGDDKYPKK